MAFHINKPTNKLKKSAKNIINTDIKHPKNEYIENPKKEYIVKKYANMRVDENLVYKIQALNAILGDKNISVTLNKILSVSLPKYLNKDNKAYFNAYYHIIKNKK